MQKIKLAVYFLAKYLGGFTIARQITSQSTRILCYHGGSIGDECEYNSLLFMRKETFRKRIKWLQDNNFQIKTLNDALMPISPSNETKKITVTLTFDDGWYSTYCELFPILFEQKIPSTLYLSTKNFTEKRPIIPVIIGYIAWKSKARQITLCGINEYIDAAYNLQSESSRGLLINNIGKWIQDAMPENSLICTVLHEIASRAKLTEEQLSLSTRRFHYLSAIELLNCGKHNCSIELHGHVHRYPSGDSVSFEKDLTDCAATITALSLPKPKHYCYPSGNFDAAASTILSQAGVISATTCVPGLVGLTSTNTLHYLPRFLDGENIHMLDFEAEMTGFAEVMRRLLKRSKPRLS